MLALQILAHNKENALTGAGAHMNLKGILVGNGVTGAGSIPGDVSEKLGVDFYFGHGLFGSDLYDQIQQTCSDFKTPSNKCESLLDQMHETIGHVNVYDLYSPCIMSMYTEEAQKQQQTTKRWVERAPASSRSLQRALDAGVVSVATVAFF